MSIHMREQAVDTMGIEASEGSELGKRPGVVWVFGGGMVQQVGTMYDSQSVRGSEPK